MTQTRRSFLAAAASTAALPFALQAKKLKTIGVQLYTVRSVIDQNPAQVLKELDGAGYREAEAVAGNLDKIWDALKATQLKPVSIHLPTQLFTKELDKLPAALDDAKKRGFEYVVCPYIAPADRGGVDMIKRLAATLTSSGQHCQKAGLKLAYHNHAFEFAPVSEGASKTLLDVLLEESDPKTVQLELDIFWVSRGGLDPVEGIRKYAKRIALMHVKDKAPGVPVGFNENVPKTAFKEVGNGELDLKAILHAADQAGVKHYFVEQDQTPGDPVASLKQSIANLRKLDY